MPTQEDIKKLIEAEQATAAQLAAQNRIERRKESILEGLKSEVGRLIVDVRALASAVEEQNRRMDTILSSETLLDLAMLSATIGETSKATQRLLDHVADKEDLILELLRFVLQGTRGNGERERLVEAVKAARPHPADEEDQAAEVAHLKKMIRLNRRNLNTLEEQAAEHGGLPPVEMVNRIEAAKAALEELREQLREVEGK